MPTIKEEMSALDRRKFDWYANLTDEDRKSLSMWVLMRYASSTSSKIHEINEHYLTLINELVNVNFNDMYKYPDLQFRLMQCAGIGSNQFHGWIKPMKKKKNAGKNKPLFNYYVNLFPSMNDDEIAFMIDLPRAELKAFLESNGLNDKQIKEMLK